MRIALLSLLGLVLVAAAGVGLIVASDRDAAAAGPCGTPHDDLDSGEVEFIALLQAWRDQNLVHPSAQLIASAPLNAAAAWQAEYLANHPFVFNGHIDGEGRNWAERADDCGYDPFWSYGSGEGVFALAGSMAFDISPAEGVEGVLYPGSGARADFPSSPSQPPFRCIGVAKARNANSTSVAWIVVLAQFPASQDCPQALSTSPGPSPSPTHTPTASPTPSPTPTPTQQTSWNSWAPGLTATD
jgi:hypothetical protein